MEMRWLSAAVSVAFIGLPPIGSTAETAAPAAPSYTFHMDVAMAMRHFPWLHFRMEGIGIYQPGQKYSVHFAKVPWFLPQQRHDTDLSMLDPTMWPSRFVAEQIGQRGSETTFSLHAVNDPTLKSAFVTLGPFLHTRHVDATYSDGTHITMSVTSGPVDGFFLPTSLTADIDEPHLALSANADFKDYDFGQ